MKKKFVVILSIQTLLIIALVVFSFIKKTEADLQRELAIQHSIMAEQQRAVAEEGRMRLEMALFQATHVTAQYQAALDSLRATH